MAFCRGCLLSTKGKVKDISHLNLAVRGIQKLLILVGASIGITPVGIPFVYSLSFFRCDFIEYSWCCLVWSAWKTRNWIFCARLWSATVAFTNVRMSLQLDVQLKTLFWIGVKENICQMSLLNLQKKHNFIKRSRK